jgi:hypothetical protein
MKAPFCLVRRHGLLDRVSMLNLKRWHRVFHIENDIRIIAFRANRRALE